MHVIVQRTTMKTRSSQKRYFLVNASGKRLGRLASEIARILQGKHCPEFTPHVDGGDGVVVICSEKVVVTGAKRKQKVYHHHTGYVGGLREISYEIMQQKKPEYIIRHAVWGMLPKTKLSRRQMRRLRIFRGKEHDCKVMKPIALEL